MNLHPQQLLAQLEAKQEETLWDSLASMSASKSKGPHMQARACKTCNVRHSTILLICESGCRTHICGTCMRDSDCCSQCSRGIKSVTPTLHAFALTQDAKDTPIKKCGDTCELCSDRSAAVHLVCKQGCRVPSCGICASSQSQTSRRVCVRCNAKVKEIQLSAEPQTPELEQGEKEEAHPCDLCNARSISHVIRCQAGCIIETCAMCIPLRQVCCGLPVDSVSTADNLKAIAQQQGRQGSSPRRSSVTYDVENQDVCALDEMVRESLEERGLKTKEDGRWTTKAGLPDCRVCNKAPETWTLGCGHRTCGDCHKKMHACNQCGKIIMSTTPIWQHQRSPLALTIASNPKRKPSNTSSKRDDARDPETYFLTCRLADRLTLETHLPALAPAGHTAGFMGYPW